MTAFCNATICFTYIFFTYYAFLHNINISISLNPNDIIVDGKQIVPALKTLKDGLNNLEGRNGLYFTTILKWAYITFCIIIAFLIAGLIGANYGLFTFALMSIFGTMVFYYPTWFKISIGMLFGLSIGLIIMSLLGGNNAGSVTE